MNKILLVFTAAVVISSSALADPETKKFDDALKAVSKVGQAADCAPVSGSAAGNDKAGRTEVKISLSCDDVEKLRPTLEKNGAPEKRIISFRDGLAAGISIRNRVPLAGAGTAPSDADTGEDADPKSPDTTVKINCLVVSKLTPAETLLMASGLKCEPNKLYQKEPMPSCSLTVKGTQLTAEQFSFLKLHTGIDLANSKATVKLKDPVTSVAWKLPKDLKKTLSVLDETGQSSHPKVEFEEWLDQKGNCQSFEISSKVVNASASAAESELVKLLAQQWKLKVNPAIQGNKSGKFECPATLR